MQDAIEASGLEVIAVSNADVTSVSRENGIELKLTVVVKPVITIEGYKGIEATKKDVEVTDEDVSAELVKVRQGFRGRQGGRLRAFPRLRSVYPGL